MRDEMSIEKIVTDDELDIAFANANFGGHSKRDMVKYGLLKAAGRWHQGHTITIILRELKLVGKNKQLTKKGGRYLYYAFGDIVSRNMV